MRKFIFKALVLSLALLMLLPAFAACTPESSDPVNTTVDSGSNKDPNTTTRPQAGENGSEGGPSDTQKEPSGEYKVLSISPFSEGLAVITTDKGYGYMNTRGEVVIAPKYSYACDFKDGWARVTDNSGKNGYIDKSGNYVIEPKYDYVSDSFDKISQVQIDGVDQYINRNGDVLYTKTGKESGMGAISNGYFWVETKEETLSGTVYTMTYYRYDGKTFVIEDAKHLNYKYTYGNISKEGHDLSSINEWGYGIVYINDFDYKLIKIDENITEVLSGPQNKDTLSGNYFRIYNSKFKNDVVYVDFLTGNIKEAQNNDAHQNYWFIDIGNNYYFIREGIGSLNYNSFLVHNDEFVLNLSTEVPEFSTANKIIGAAQCEYNGKNYFAILLESSSRVTFTALIDEDGNVLISPQNKYSFTASVKDGRYTTAYVMPPITDGIMRARSEENALYGYIDLAGNWVIQPQYDQATDFTEDGVAVVNGNTVINKNGDVIFTCAE